MPYRRLPKTDQARIQSLSKALELESLSINEIPVSFRLLNEAKTQLPIFRNLVHQYNTQFERQVNENRKYQQYVKNARMYISHFIQVLNLTVIRGEIKKENKLLYQLDVEDHVVPDLTSEASLLEWGDKVIKGESDRVSRGGIGLQNPTIAKVRVHYDIFKQNRESQKTHQNSTARYLKNVADMRDKIDDLIKQIWDEIEASYQRLPPYKRWKKCASCGVIYYYRKNEPELTPAIDEAIERNKASQPELF